MEHNYLDLTEEEEADLPLPEGWITMIKIPSQIDSTLRVYKNVRLGIESTEHPFILQAQNNAKKTQLSSDWSLKTVSAPDGSQDIFYHNSTLEFSMWDHPLLRDNLCILLAKAGHDPVSLGIKKAVPPIRPIEVARRQSVSGSNIPDDQMTLRSSISFSVADRSQRQADQRSVRSSTHSVQSGRSSEVLNQFERSSGVPEEGSENDNDDEDYEQQSHQQPHSPVPMEIVQTGQPELVSPLAVENYGRLYLDDLGTLEGSRHSSRSHQPNDNYHQQDSHENQYDDDYEQHLQRSNNGDKQSPAGNGEHASPVESQAESVVDNRRDWESLLDVYKDPGLEYADKISHRVKHIKPPVTLSGIRVLREDVMEANERVHQLLIKMRSLLSVKSGIECSMLYHENGAVNHSPGSAARNNVTLASDIVTALRQRPEYIVLAMANSNNVRDGSPVMVQLAFTALHRILHPCSSDNSMTTAILLQGINYQLDELTAVEQVFSEVDSKIIIARALFIADPDCVVKWDPLQSPLPTVPEMPSETVLGSLLRVYAIRRDVTSYYRTIWKPVLPGVVALLKLHSESATDPNYHNSKPHIFGNIMSVAHRLLECTLSEKSVLIFPATATAVCRAVNELGGRLAVHTYLFQLLILPNLLKVLAGDHESAENEDIYRVENVEEIVNKYYDNSFWFNKDPSAAESEPGILDPLRTLIWLVWRLYTCAVFMEDTAMTALTMQDFLAPSKPIALDSSAYAYPSLRLRNMLMRLRRKIDRGCAFLLQLPMDAQGSEYLGVNEEDEGGLLDHQIQKLEGHAEMAQLLDRRLHTLHFKPNEMLNLTVASKYEIGALFSDVALGMEMHDQAAQNPIYQAIAEYLNQNMDYDTEDAHEQLMELTFLYVTDDFNGIEFDSQQGMAEEKNGEVHDFIAARYDQLIRGLRLCNRYEDSLIKMIQRTQNNQISSLFELTEDETWFHAPEFDPAVKAETVKIARKHTAGSKGKVKSAHFGLKRAANVAVFPLFARQNSQDHHPNFRSMKQLQNDVFASYRFHTTASSATVGTTLARPKVAAPKVHPSSVNVTTAESRGGTAVAHNRSRYTKIEVKPNANILAPTKSFASHNLPIKENRDQKHKKFLKSLRDHDIIPTDEFQVRYHKIIMERRRRKEILQDQQQHSPNGRRSVLEPSYAANPVRAPAGRILKEFPEHLRAKLHRMQPQSVAPVHYGDDQQYYSDGQSQGYYRSNNSSRHGSRNGSPNRMRPQYDSAGPGYYSHGGNETPQSLAQEIIQGYSNLFSAPPTVDTTFNRPQFMYTAPESHHRSVSPSVASGRSRTRARSPGLPEPIPGFQSQFQSPTRSRLYSLVDHSDLELRRSLEFRKHERNTEFEAPVPFSPTMKKIHPPKGLRVNRVPEFLHNEEISDYTRSRSTSRTMSRSNSFSSSPVRGRSRNNSFSNLTHICKRDPPPGPEQDYQFEDVDEEYEHIVPPFASAAPIDAPTPIPTPAPNTVNIDLSQLREIERRNNFAQASEDLPVPEPVPHSNGSLPKTRKVNVSLVAPPPEVASSAESAATFSRPTFEGMLSTAFPARSTSNNPTAMEVPPVIAIRPPVKRQQGNMNMNYPSLQAPQETVLAPAVAEAPPVMMRPRPLQPRAAPTLAAHLSSSEGAADLFTAPVNNTQTTERVSVSVPPPALSPVVAVPDSHPARAVMPVPKQVAQAVPEPRSVSASFVAPAASAPVVPPPVETTAAPAVPAAGTVCGGRVMTRYSILFPRVDADEDAPHIYNVNAAHEEAYQRAKDSIHRGGGDQHSGSDGEEEDYEEDLRFLGYAAPTSAARMPGMMSSKSSRQKSMQSRASKVILDDQQLIQILIDGFQAIKYGRSGKSKPKIVKYIPGLKTIEWENLGTDRLKLIKSLSFFRRASSNEPLTSGEEERAACIPLDAIRSVCGGVQTDVLLKAGLVDPDCCLSLVTDARTLDLTLANATERDRVIRGLRILLQGKDVKFL